MKHRSRNDFLKKHSVVVVCPKAILPPNGRKRELSLNVLAASSNDGESQALNYG